MNENEPNFELWLKTREFAAALGISPRTASHWAAQRKVTFLKTPGGHLRFPPWEVDRILATGWSSVETEADLPDLLPFAFLEHDPVALGTIRRRAV